MSGQVTRVLFEHASVLDAEAGTLVPDQSVVVDGARIAEVGASSQVRCQPDRTIEWDPLESTCRHASLSIL